jgi:glycosyltransferase involved in cell wall biosynthesis
MTKTLAVIIPAYNEEGSLEKVLRSLPKQVAGVAKLVSIVVEDGSADKTYQVAQKSADYVVRHVVNLGLGAALTSGIKAAQKINADMAITLDGDGQHNSEEITKMIDPIIKGKAEVVIGTRMLNTKAMPKIKIFGNWAMNVITFLIYHKWTTDSQSGLRAFSKKALHKIRLSSIAYEVSSEIIGEIQRNKLKMVEVPIETIYTDYSKAKGQSWLNGVNILTKSIYLRLSRLK